MPQQGWENVYVIHYHKELLINNFESGAVCILRKLKDELYFILTNPRINL